MGDLWKANSQKVNHHEAEGMTVIAAPSPIY